jgi:hypothetical protein
VTHLPGLLGLPFAVARDLRRVHESSDDGGEATRALLERLDIHTYSQALCWDWLFARLETLVHECECLAGAKERCHLDATGGQRFLAERAREEEWWE